MEEAAIMSSAPHVVKPLLPGQHLSVKEFLRRWEAMPDLKFAELIDGVVYMPSPQTSDHGVIQNYISMWLGTYAAYTRGCQSGEQSTWLMLKSAPQPDIYLWILPECGGQSKTRGKYHVGAPELAAEVCYSSGSYDLGVKKVLYEQAGVQEYVAVLVEEQEVRWHRLVKGKYQLQRAGARAIYQSVIFPGLSLASAALWRNDRARVLRTLQRGLDSAAHAKFVRTLAEYKNARP
jgi:Uma2 family endonuclease